MGLSFSEDDIYAKARHLGLIADGEALPRHLRSKVVAALAAEQQPRPEGLPPIAQSIVIDPGGAIDVDGRPFPWLVLADQMQLTLNPDGSGTVRLALPCQSLQITKPRPESENRA